MLGHDGADQLEASGLARTLCAGRCRREVAGRPARSRRLLRNRTVYLVADRLQFEARQNRGRAQKLRRPARQKMDRKIVKAHPGYSGTIMTVTFQLSRALGWDFFQKLGQQRVMQVQSAAEPPKKVAQGERPIAADGGEYFMLQIRDQGGAIEPVYPSEGTPSIPGGAAVIVDAPHPSSSVGCCRATANNCSSTRAGCAPFTPT